MGNKTQQSSSPIPNQMDKIESMLYDTYRNSDIDFTHREVLTIKLREGDAEKYFQTNYDYLLYFNSFIFHERLAVLYDNFSAVVEKFCKQANSSTFKMLIDFDEEVDYTENHDNTKIEYESLFTIIFEPLEITTALFFLMTSHNKNTLADFFGQLYESIYLYKNNRKFDIMYFLLPNLDFMIRNESYLVYIVNQPNAFDESLDILSDYTVKYVNQYTDGIFLSLYFKQMLKVKYNQLNQANNYIDVFIPNLIPTPQFIKAFFHFDFAVHDINDFINHYEREFKIFELLSANCNVNMFLIYIDNAELKGNAHTNIEMLLKKLVLLLDKSNFAKASFIVRFLCMTTQKQFDIKAYQILYQQINEMILTLINESFSHGMRLRVRKIIVELLVGMPQEEGEVDLNNSLENFGVKFKSEMKFHFWKCYYAWFLTEKHVKKMKNKIYTLLYDKINGNEHIMHNVFEFLFTKRNYLRKEKYKEGKRKLIELERMFCF